MSNNLFLHHQEFFFCFNIKKNYRKKLKKLSKILQKRDFLEFDFSYFVPTPKVMQVLKHSLNVNDTTK